MSLKVHKSVKEMGRKWGVYIWVAYPKGETKDKSPRLCFYDGKPGELIIMYKACGKVWVRYKNGNATPERLRAAPAILNNERDTHKLVKILSTKGDKNEKRKTSE